jgi:hypothetical protein
MLYTTESVSLFVLGNLLGSLTTTLVFCLMMYNRRFGEMFGSLPSSCSGNGIFVIGNSGNVEVHPMDDTLEDNDTEEDDKKDSCECPTGVRVGTSCSL